MERVNTGEQKVPFEKIARIEKERHGCLVTFKSGKQIFLDDSNDVDDGNRGVQVYVPELGSVKIDWTHFKSVDFEWVDQGGPAYNAFEEPVGLNAEVILYDEQVKKGFMVFDIDEMWEMEFLDGSDQGILYQIPFRNVRRIIPKNREFSMVELLNGERLLIGDEQDVSCLNDGLLLYRDRTKEPIHIDWDNISEIIYFEEIIPVIIE